MNDIIIYPFLSVSFRSNPIWQLSFQENDGNPAKQISIPETEFGSISELLEYLACRMSELSTCGNIYSSYFEAISGKVVFARVSGGVNFTIQWKASSGTIALAKMLGFNSDIMDLEYESLKRSCYNPRYAWCPMRGFANYERQKISRTIVTRNFKGSVSSTVLPYSAGEFRISFETLLSDLVFKSPSNPFAAFESFWEDARQGGTVTVFDHRSAPQTDITPLEVTIGSETTEIEFADATAHEGYLDGYAFLICESKNKGIWREVISSGYASSGRGKIVVDNYLQEATPESRGAIFYPSRKGVIAPESGECFNAFRMSSGVDFYSVEFSLWLINE